MDTTENIQNGDYSNLDKLFDKYEEHEDWLEEVEDGEWLANADILTIRYTKTTDQWQTV